VKIFVDANILFSASQKESPTRKVFEAATLYAEIVSNVHAWEEAKRNLLLKRPQYSAGLKQLERHVRLSYAFYKDLTIDLPQQDVPVLSGAIGSECTHLWTSDKRHFGKFYEKKIQGVTVVSSVMLADILIKMGWGR